MSELPVLNLSASSSVAVEPDRATLTFGVISRSTQNAQTAMEGAREIMNRVVDQVRAFGVARHHVRTSDLRLSDREIHEGPQRVSRIQHEAQNRLTIQLDRLDQLGEVLDAVVSAGVNTITGVSFGCGDTSAARDEARRSAMSDLKASAALYASLGGYAEARLKQLGEQVDASASPDAGPRMSRRAEAATPIEAGELSVTVRLSGLFELVR